MKPPSFLVRLLVLVLVFGMAIFAGLLWWKDGTSSVDPQDSTPVIFVINRGEGIKSIAQRLSQENLIRSPTAFFILVKLLNIDSDIQAGDFRLNPAMDAPTVARELTHGIVDVWVTTLEGWRVDEVATKLAKELDIPEGEFLRVAQEGYMFPDTYLVPRSASAAAVVKLFTDTFDKKVTDQMRQDAALRGLSLSQLVTLASIVEREGRTDEDRPVIAGILLNRLREGWPLQADATLQYALGYQSAEKTWWKQGLTTDDKEIDSLFNTYKHLGLPPGPISNPGLSSIRAAVYPMETEYWFYLHDPNGGVHYATTLEEHNANIAQYLR